MSVQNSNLQVYAMELELIELTQKNEICQTYEIYKHCMFMPTEEKFNKKIDSFLYNRSIKTFACCNQSEIEGVIVVSFVEQNKIVGIAVDASVLRKYNVKIETASDAHKQVDVGAYIFELERKLRD